MPELLLLAIASAFWPVLVVVVIVSLRAGHPVRLLVSFLVGGLLTTVTVGLVILYVLEGSSLGGRPKHAFEPWVKVTVGALAVVAAVVLWKRLPQREALPAPKPVPAAPGRLERMLDRGAPLAFVAGIAFNVVPGVFPLVAIAEISTRNLDIVASAGLLLAFYVIMFALIEVPLVSYVVAPEWTGRETERFNAALDRNGRKLAIGALGVFGAYLLVKGAVEALTA
jgi:hypothetical protein